MLFRLLLFIGLASCGVKGRPLPPDTPREIGIGKPSYEGIDKELTAPDPDEDEDNEDNP